MYMDGYMDKHNGSMHERVEVTFSINILSLKGLLVAHAIDLEKNFLRSSVS
jgi:hypothetical protein